MHIRNTLHTMDRVHELNDSYYSRLVVRVTGNAPAY